MSWLQEIGVTRTAIRAHLATLQQDDAVEQRGTQKGVSKPARTYGVTTEAELLLSKAYVPILTQLLHVLANRMPSQEFDAILREVGRGLMAGQVTRQGDIAGTDDCGERLPQRPRWNDRGR